MALSFLHSVRFALVDGEWELDAYFYHGPIPAPARSTAIDTAFYRKSGRDMCYAKFATDEVPSNTKEMAIRHARKLLF